MKSIVLAAGVAALVFAGPAVAADLRPLEDAPLFAIQFIDHREGWAAGADGGVWHTIDAGKSWERQPTGTRAVLRSLCFIDPYTGWAVGREEAPHHGGSSGVVLCTRDGGLKWSRLSDGDLPGLNFVHFFSAQLGVAAGDGTDRDPSGLWLTRDGGRTWTPVPGPRCPTWRCGDFTDANTGALGGAWGRLAAVRGSTLHPADVDKLGGRAVLGIRLSGSRGVAVGQGGLVLLSQDSAGARWGFADLQIAPELLATLEFHGVACQQQSIWIVGQPGSIVWHSADLGKTWRARPTGQSLPLHAVHFRDDTHGWAVGDGGTIVATADGGATWTVQRRGAQRCAVAFIHARGINAPLETIALAGADEAYITAAIQVTSAEPASADPRRATDPDRWLAAQRKLGGSAAISLHEFPLPPHLVDARRPDLTAEWDRAIRGSSSRRLAALMTQFVRTWRPEVVVTDFSGAAVDAVVAEAVKEACDRAGDPKAFPEQLTALQLEPWAPKRLVAAWNAGDVAPIFVNADEPRRRLGDSLRGYAAPALALLSERPAELPVRRSFRALNGGPVGADLFTGLALAYGGTARRAPPGDDPSPDRLADVDRAIQERRTLQALSKPDWGRLSDSSALLAQIGPSLSKLPVEQAAPAAFAIAQQYAQSGQWRLAREAFALLVERYPGHPLAIDSYRWLIQFHASSEARRREELGQFLVLTTTDVRQAGGAPTRDDPVIAGSRTVRPVSETTAEQQTITLTNASAARRWFEGALAVESRLAAFGPRVAEDPAVQFTLHAARRQLGDFERPKSWVRSFLMQPRSPGVQGTDPWRENAAAELWLAERSGPPPKPVANCRLTESRPYLDGNLDDDCWRDATPIVLKSADGSVRSGYETRAFLTYDAEYLYVGINCALPAERFVAPVDRRTRDADLRPFDRVSLMIDLDRDYQTYFHWQIDQRGAVAEDCWGDRNWNPRWLVAHRSAPDGWSAELAIPWQEITGDAVSLGKAWCVNLVRITPGAGLLAFSHPADVQPRPEGMGLMIFTAK